MTDTPPEANEPEEDDDLELEEDEEDGIENDDNEADLLESAADDLDDRRAD